MTSNETKEFQFRNCKRILNCTLANLITFTLWLLIGRKGHPMIHDLNYRRPNFNNSFIYFLIFNPPIIFEKYLGSFAQFYHDFLFFRVFHKKRELLSYCIYIIFIVLVPCNYAWPLLLCPANYELFHVHCFTRCVSW